MDYTFLVKLGLHSFLVLVFAYVGLYIFCFRKSKCLPNVIVQLWTLGTIYTVGSFVLEIENDYTWYNAIIAFISYSAEGLYYWLFAIEYLASAASIN